MDGRHLPYPLPSPQRDELCFGCADISNAALDEYRLPSINLADFRDAQKFTRLEAALATAPNDLRDFEFESLPFGRMAMMNVTLSCKVSNFDEVDASTRARWLSYIRTGAQSYIVTDKICGTVKPRALLHYNDYCISLGARAAGKKHGIPVFSLTHPGHLGTDRRRIQIVPEPWSHYCSTFTGEWKEWRELALPGTLVEEISRDMFHRFAARSAHNYSPAKTAGPSDLHARLGFSRDKKLLVAFTSSLDEAVAMTATNLSLGFPPLTCISAFRDQIEWIQALLEFIANNQSLQLVVRIHPREGANKRENKVSQHLGQLKHHFSGTFERVRFVWPGEDISSYDLAEIADLSLISWSSIGLETARLGLPVLSYMEGYSQYPTDDFLICETTREAYFRKLSSLVGRPASLETIARAFRCHYVFNLATTLPVDDVVPSSDFLHIPSFHLPAQAKAFERAIIKGERTLDINREALQSEQSVQALNAERDALQSELRKVIHYIHTGELPNKEIEVNLLVEGSYTTYEYNGKVYERYSPLCARLAPLCAELAQPRRVLARTGISAS